MGSYTVDHNIQCNFCLSNKHWPQAHERFADSTLILMKLFVKQIKNRHVCMLQFFIVSPCCIKVALYISCEIFRDFDLLFLRVVSWHLLSFTCGWQKFTPHLEKHHFHDSSEKKYPSSPASLANSWKFLFSSQAMFSFPPTQFSQLCRQPLAVHCAVIHTCTTLKDACIQDLYNLGPVVQN